MICFDPNATFEFSIPLHESCSDPPVFVGRYLTMRECYEFCSRCDRLLEAKSEEEAAEIIKTCFTNVLRGWRNIPNLPFSPDRIPDLMTVFSIAEIREVFSEIIRRCVVGPREKKR